MFAKVVIDIKSPNLLETFDYHIPPELSQFVFIGSRVLVPFAFREVLGYVIKLSEDSEYKESIKDIKEVYSLERELLEEQVNVAIELSQELNAPLVYTLSLMMPSFLKEQSRKTIHIEDYSALNPELALLFKGKKKVTLDKTLMKSFPLIQQEIKKGSLSLGYEFYTYGKNKRAKYYRLLQNSPQKTQVRENILAYLSKNPNALEDDIVRSIPTSIYMLRKMASERLIAYSEKTLLENGFSQVNKPKKTIFTSGRFTYDQEQLLAKYYESKNKPFLLFTTDNAFLGSFFLNVLEHNLASKELTVFIAPNILYAEELSAFLREHSVGLNLYTYHSKNSYSDNYAAYMSIKHERCDCLIATPMGVFLPFSKVGTFFVCDEESEDYIYPNFPYYHAREVALKRARNLEARIVLTSQTPAISTYYAVILNQIHLLDDHHKILNKTLLVDMHKELLEENNDIISTSLITEIKQALTEKRISLLIVNQKAFATMIFCRACDKVLKCPKCKIPLVLYEQKGYAKCNYCDYKTEEYHHCDCGAKQMISSGFGMEQVEYKIRNLFPSARVLSFALTEQKSSDDYNQYLASLEENEVDIIIGTYALTKSFHYDNIKVVGLLYADSFLHLNDFRASEYTYDLIAKLLTREVVIIQTYHAGHYAITHALSNDYYAFFDEEIANRKLLEYEPFVEMNRIVIKGASGDSYHFANYFAKIIKKIPNFTILGPTYDFRLRSVKLIIKHNNYPTLIRIFNDALKHFNKPHLQISFERYPKR